MDIYQKTYANAAEFKEALQRNLYRGAAVSDEQVGKIMDYVGRWEYK
jgi:DNA transposition AAA+ family ATPase